MGQLAMTGLLPGSYWVTVVNHGVIPSGTRFLVVEECADGWLRCWRDGTAPLFSQTGTLLRPEHVEREGQK
jgi:hypothetical protein